MLVVCPFCKKTQQYNNYKQSAKRFRKKCCFCSRKFEINESRILRSLDPRSRSGIQDKPADQTMDPSLDPSGFKGGQHGSKHGHLVSDQGDLGHSQLTVGHFSADMVNNYSKMTIILDPVDKKILDLISRGLIQVQIAAKLKLSKQSVSRRIKRLVRLGILIDLQTYPRFYKLNPDFLRIDKKNKLCIECHDLRVKLNVKSNFREFEKFRSQINKSVELQHWVKKYLNINNVNFEITTKSILFHVTGIGETVQDAIDNAKTKAVEIRDYLQKKFNLRLEFPIFHENQVDYVLLKIPQDNYQKLRKLWNDKSHPELLETDDKLLANTIQQTIKTTEQNKSDLELLKNEIVLLRSAILNLANKLLREN